MTYRQGKHIDFELKDEVLEIKPTIWDAFKVTGFLIGVNTLLYLIAHFI